MMPVPEELRYTKTHEWSRCQDAEIMVGITSHAQEELRDIVFVELPKPGQRIRAGEACAVVESVKAAFDIYAPITGTVSRVNTALATRPQLVNEDCYGTGWFFALKADQPEAFGSLLTAQQYQALLGEGSSSR